MSARIVDLTGNTDDLVYAYMEDAELGLVDLLARYASEGNSISTQNDVHAVSTPEGAVVYQFTLKSEFEE